MANELEVSAREAFWRCHLERHREGGGSITSYCREHGLAESSFYGKRTVNRRGGSPPPDSTNPGFVLFGTFSFLLADFIDFPPVLGVAFQPGIGE